MAQVEDDFEVGKSVFEKLKDLSPDRQQRVLRWVAESLGAPLIGASGQTTQSGVPPPAAAPLAAAPTGGSATDIKTFVATKGPKSDMQFAAVVAYYYRFEAFPTERRDSIDSNVLQDAARRAGRSRLKKPLVTLNNAKKAGYIDSPSPGNFTINSVGENLVAMALPASGNGATRKARKKKISRQSGTRRNKRAKDR